MEFLSLILQDSGTEASLDILAFLTLPNGHRMALEFGGLVKAFHIKYLYWFAKTS